MKKHKKITKGFTLVELVIVLVILAILVGIAMPAFMGVRKKAYRAEALQIFSEIKSLAWCYNLEKSGASTDAKWPNDTSETVNWQALGYATQPDTAKWNFTIPNPSVDTTTSGCTISGGCFNVTAQGRDVATGQSIRFLLNASGVVFID